MSSHAVAEPKAVLEHGAHRQRIARSILSGVFRGEIVSGARLVVQPLCQRFGVSPTPIREALVELAGIGILDLRPNVGAVVRPFGRRQLLDICRLRRLLEREATRLACGRTDPAELERLAQSLRRLIATVPGPAWSAETRRVDTQLHEMIARCCGSERLADEIGRYAVLFSTLRDVAHQRRESRQDHARSTENAEHLTIVEALMAGDGRSAERAMSRHIRNAARGISDDLFPATHHKPARKGGQRS